MNIISATNPQWANTEQTAININVHFEGIGIIPFTASPADSEAHGRDIFARAVAGEFGGIVVKPPKTPAELDAEVSSLAKQALAEIDLKSIRALREYIAAKADAPAVLKAYETQAQVERTKVRP